MRLWLLLFALLLIVFEAAVLLWWQAVAAGRQREMTHAIRAGVASLAETPRPVVLIESPPTGPNRIVAFFLSLLNVDDQAGLTVRRLSIMAAAAIAGLLLGSRFTGIAGIAAPIAGAVIGAAAPGMYYGRKKRRRFTMIEEQLPEALDCLARSLRAGNALSVAIDLLAQEIHEPLRTEFRKLTRELALGGRLEDALNGLIARVPLLEVRFFVSAVLLQRETGGNLSEVISKLSISLRERFKLRGHVKAASGQGRLSAYVLTALPVAILLLLHTVSPDYLNSLTDDPLGRRLLVGAAVSQVVGYLLIRRIINIEV